MALMLDVSPGLSAPVTRIDTSSVTDRFLCLKMKQTLSVLTEYYRLATSALTLATTARNSSIRSTVSCTDKARTRSWLIKNKPFSSCSSLLCNACLVSLMVNSHLFWQLKLKLKVSTDVE